MSKSTAAITKAKFASKPEVKPEAQAEAVEFKSVQRNDGVLSHNLEYLESDGYLYLRINMTAPTTPAKSGNPLISTTRGFAIVAGKINLSLNALVKK